MISAKGFVTQNAGKLRDYYRIGKMLGSGMIVICQIQAFRRLRRSANVRSQGDGCAKSSQSVAQEPHGRRREENAVQRNQHPERARKFSKICKIANSLFFQDHPNIVKMYEFFEDDKRYYIVTE